MRKFDISKQWIILGAVSDRRPLERAAALELARWLGLLRCRAMKGSSGEPIPIMDADGPSPDESLPIIVLNSGDASNGFSWRAGEDRVEIYGDSPKGLLNGVFDFLGALGFRWEAVGSTLFPSAGGEIDSPQYALSRSGAYEKPDPSQRTILSETGGGREAPAEQIARAARNKADVVYFGPTGRYSPPPALTREVLETARNYGIEIEVDGPSARTLVPRFLFPFKRDLFRMRRGRRSADLNFCPSNPDTVALIVKRAARFFRAHPNADAYRFLPDAAQEANAWCSCPTCRAFTPVEQALIAANAEADALAKISPRARMAVELETADGEGAAVEPRRNVTVLRQRGKEKLKPEVVGT